SQHIERMLLHRVIGITRRMLRPIAFAAAAPVDPYHPEVTRKHRCGELDPVLAGEIAVEKDDRGVALPPFPPAEADFSRTDPRQWPPYVLRPAAGFGRSGVGATAAAETTPLIRRSVSSGELVSSIPVDVKSVTSAANSTGLSVWMKCPVSG